MFKKLNILFILSLLISGLFAKNNALILSSGAYITLKGGTSGIPIRLIINQANATGITRLTANQGWIVSEGEFNYVQWNIATSTGNYIIPYNYSSTDIPFSMNITGAGVAGSSVLFSTYHTDASNNLPIATYDGTTVIPNINNASGSNNSAKMLDRWWIVDATSGYTTKPAATLSFSYIDLEHSVASNIIAEANLQAQSYNTSTSNWIISDLFGTDVPASNYVNNAVVPASKLFRAWVLVDNISPLPIELLSFNAICENTIVNLKWTTASETNNDYFTVERSLSPSGGGAGGGFNWNSIATVDGAGNSNSPLTYTTYDLSPYTGTSYYRLLQTDFDGKSETFDPVAVSCESNLGQASVAYFPNPFTSEIVVNIKNIISENATITIYNIFGSKVFTKNISRGELERKTLTLNLGDLVTGLYAIEFRSDSYTNTEKIVKN